LLSPAKTHREGVECAGAARREARAARMIRERELSMRKSIGFVDQH
jgi:hypothetical protein